MNFELFLFVPYVKLVSVKFKKNLVSERWPPILKNLEISSNGPFKILFSYIMAAITKNRNFFKWCYFKPEKFELYKHNDELFNIYYGIFYEL